MATNAAVELEEIDWLAAGEAWLLRVGKFPVAEPEMPVYRDFVERLTAALITAWDLRADVLGQVFELGRGLESRVVADNSRRWFSILGLGVWPNRPPPTVWKKEDFLDADPDVGIRPLMDTVLRIPSQKLRAEARAAMAGTGILLQVLLPGREEDLLERARRLFLPSIQERILRGKRFFFPLLERRTLEGASSQQLQDWYCGATVYMRESREDTALLMPPCARWDRSSRSSAANCRPVPPIAGGSRAPSDWPGIPDPPRSRA